MGVWVEDVSTPLHHEDVQSSLFESISPNSEIGPLEQPSLIDGAADQEFLTPTMKT